MSGRIAIATLITLALAACGPEPRETNNIGTDPNNQSTNNTNNTNNNTTGTNNNTVLPINAGFGPECAGVECPDDRRCVRGTCVLADLLVACEVPEDLGTLEPGEVYMGTGDNSGYADGIVTSCGGDGELSGSENAFLFTVEEPGVVDFEITATDSPFDWVIEARRDCADGGDAPAENNGMENNTPSAPAVCSTSASTSVVVEPGEEYWLLVEPNNSLDTGTFDWVLTFESLMCDPGRTCADDNTILACIGGMEEESLACGTSCNDGACAGDSCASAIEVTAGMSWSGNARAFTNTLDFGDEPTCSQDGVEGLSTPGPELILSLPGLTTGQRVIIDASMMDDNDNAIFVLSECSDAVECLAARDLSDVLEWDVPADGDYFVVIDKFTNSDQTYNYTIDIQ